ncbi:MAG: glutamine--fructose-6-phosphate transaminase (isomerizing), partial [candidate division WOR-3 bacterium]
AILNKEYPDMLIGVRKDSPLIIGVGNDEMFLASDIPAILPHTKKIIILNNEEIAILRYNDYKIIDFEGNLKTSQIRDIEWDAQMAEKGPYPHFMLKEIYEQPEVIERNINKYIRDGEFLLLKDHNLRKLLLNKDRIIIQAAGTSLHAGIVGRYLIENFSRIPVDTDYSSEFSHRIVDDKTLIMAISQSGETMDTLEGLRRAKNLGLEVLSIVNVVDSSIARESDYVIYINAGPEIGVASTKAYTAQITILLFLALELGYLKGFVDKKTIDYYISEIRKLPYIISSVLYKDTQIQYIAQKFHKNNHFMFLGRGMNYPTALEGALKLKEISYIHATGYAAGEMKHGPLALVDENWPVVVINPKTSVYEKTLSNANEVYTRGGKIISIVSERDEKMKEISQEIIEIPEVNEYLTPIVSIVPLQLLAYHIANLRGCDVDKPRNIAKVITVP